MSFSQEVRKEVMELKGISKLEMLGEVKTVLLAKNGIKDNKIEIKLDNIRIASRFYGILQELEELKIVIKYSISKNFGEHKVYTITIPKQKGLKEFVQKLKNITNSLILANEEYLKGAMRGYLIYCGYLKDPEKEYAIDYFIDSEEGADELYELLIALGKKASKTIKKSKNLVYLRNAEDILDILVNVGAMQSFFKFEEITMIKDLKNRTIREMNWEVANETKTLNSANRQLHMIDYIENIYGLENLTPGLREIVDFRRRYPESSFQEIAEYIGISKSGVKNRFRRIENLYNDLKENEGEK